MGGGQLLSCCLFLQARTLAIVRACEKLTEVTAQLKTILVVNDFSQINRSIDVLNEEATKKEKSVRNKMEKHEENVIDVLSMLRFLFFPLQFNGWREYGGGGGGYTCR